MTQEDKLYDFLKSQNFTRVKEKEIKRTGGVTKILKDYEWQFKDLTVSYVINDDNRRLSYKQKIGYIDVLSPYSLSAFNDAFYEINANNKFVYLFSSITKFQDSFLAYDFLRRQRQVKLKRIMQNAQ
jgi:hypothetical protein